MNHEDLALLISGFSFVLAGIALGWNIYRDAIAKPKLCVNLKRSALLALNNPESYDTKIILSGTNFGPGPIDCRVAYGKKTSFLLWLFRREKYSVILHDWKDGRGDQFPKRLELGESVNIIFPYESNPIDNDVITHVGIGDSFGRRHWAPRADVIRVQKGLRKDMAGLAESS